MRLKRKRRAEKESLSSVVQTPCLGIDILTKPKSRPLPNCDHPPTTHVETITLLCRKNLKNIIGRRNGSNKFQTPHPSLIGGKNPIVRMAGMVDIRNGKIHSWDDRSGHFKPNIKSMKYADEAFGKLSKEIFVKDFNGGKK